MLPQLWKRTQQMKRPSSSFSSLSAPESHSKEGMRKEDVGFGNVIETLKRYGHNKSLQEGRAMHSHIIVRYGQNPSSFLSNCLVQMYGLCGSTEDAKNTFDRIINPNNVSWTVLIKAYSQNGEVSKARDVFDKMPHPDVIAWNTMIAAYAQNGCCQDAIEHFVKMQICGSNPSNVTAICVLDACIDMQVGYKIHNSIIEFHFEDDIIVGNALVTMYGRCGETHEAEGVFMKMKARNVVTWSALIGGYARHGFGEEALKCFRHMNDARIRPNAVTYVCVLNACGIVGSLEIGKYIDAEVRKQGLLWNNVLLGTALVDMYSKCGALKNAREIFEKLSVRNIVSWSALIGGYVQHGLGEDALKCFKQMNDARVRPNGVTYVCILKACGIVGSLEIGEAIHAELRKQGLLEKDVVLGNALIDMYSKCGVPEKAQEVFNQLLVRNVVSWSTLINGHAQLGQTNVVLNLYRQMIAEGIVPNSVTFIVLLTACSHAGLMEEGEQLFHEMRAAYCLEPILEHYTCMIDLFGRAGHFDKMKTLIDKVSNSRYLPLFLTVLGACRKWRNVKLGRWAFEQAIGLDERCSAAYVCMKNIYVSVGMEIESELIEAWRLKNNKAWKNRDGIETEHKDYQYTHAYAKLVEINKKLSQEGYSLGKSENVLCCHSENLDVAWALINTPKGMPIHITKNVRVCHALHSDISFISMVEKRRIQVNGARCIHIFEDGLCMCNNQYGY